MKKMLLFTLIAIVALSFVGCASSRERDLLAPVRVEAVRQLSHDEQVEFALLCLDSLIMGIEIPVKNDPWGALENMAQSYYEIQGRPNIFQYLQKNNAFQDLRKYHRPVPISLTR